MHGVKKLKTTEDKERERKAENRKTIEKYLGHLRTVIAKSQSKSFDEEGLRESASALTISPDSNVLWNYRKVALLAFGPEERQSRGVAELTLLEQCIRANTKSYWVWFHRKWVAENLLPTSMDWQRELGLCNKLLDLDSRNCSFPVISLRFIFSPALVTTHSGGDQSIAGITGGSLE